jgi:putative flippase GtrA/glycosyltransferase involved in cell wall biosynthesis
MRYLRRFAKFGSVGTAVLLAGLGLLTLLIEVCGLHPSIAYLLTAVFSIETNFLLNKFFVWKDKPGKFWHHWRRFHIARLVTIPLNQLVFNFMIASGFTWIVATLIGQVISTGVNFLGLDQFVFKDPIYCKSDFPKQLTVHHLPYVSVIIPARNEQASIRGCVAALLNQDYPPHEIIVATEPNDPTIGAIKDWIQQGKVRHVVFVRPGKIQTSHRDTNARRYQGLLHATGDILVLTDSKIRTPKDWLHKIVYLIAEHGNDVVAGITTRMPSDTRFLAVLSDEGFYRENPRFATDCITPENYGKFNGLPVTANLAFTRHVFETIQFPTQGFMGWEDYALTSAILETGFCIKTTNELVVYRTHKPTLRMAKHAVTGIATWVFRKQNHNNAFVKNRHKNAVLITLILLGGLGFVTGAAAIYGGLIALYSGLAMSITMFTLLGIYNVYLAKDIRAFAFPPIILLQIIVWIIGYWTAAIFGGDVPSKITETLKSLRMLLFAA